MSTADHIFINGAVLTMDHGLPDAEAVAVKDGFILAVGTNKAIQAHKGPKTKVTDLAGRTLMPGFVESHLHIFSGAEEQTLPQLPEVRGFEALRKISQAYGAAHPDEPLICAQGASYEILGNGERLTRHHLDKIFPDRPFVVTSSCHHTAWANTVALEKAGLLYGKEMSPGNEIVMGADGKANGELREMEAMQHVYSIGSPTRNFLGLDGKEPGAELTQEDRVKDKATLRLGLEYCASFGITSLHNMDGNLYQLELFEEIEKEDGGLKCRVQIPFHYKNFMSPGDLEKASAMSRRFKSETLKCGRVKAFYDGVLESYTAVMQKPYTDLPDRNGVPLFSEEAFEEMIVECDKRGLQISVHAIGDGAVNAVLNAYETARKKNGIRDSRHRIEHLEVILPADIPRFKELGVIASIQPLHAGFPGSDDGPTAPMIGKERLKYAYAQRSMLEAGAVVIFSSDWPVVTLNPMITLLAATKRKKWTPDMPDQRFTLRETLKAYTNYGAYTEFMENAKGMIRPGFFADLCVLSENIETSDDYARIKVDLTMLGGKITHLS